MAVKLPENNRHWTTNREFRVSDKPPTTNVYAGHGDFSGTTIYPESYLRRIESEAGKHPDGLIADREKGFSLWLEVENARKSGRNIDKLVEALAKASRATPVTYFDVVQDAPVTLGLVAIDADARDERGFRLNHLHRIESTLQKIGLLSPLPLAIAWITLKGVGVESVRMEHKIYNPTR